MVEYDIFNIAIRADHISGLEILDHGAIPNRILSGGLERV